MKRFFLAQSWTCYESFSKGAILFNPREEVQENRGIRKNSFCWGGGGLKWLIFFGRRPWKNPGKMRWGFSATALIVLNTLERLSTWSTFRDGNGISGNNELNVYFFHLKGIYRSVFFYE